MQPSKALFPTFFTPSSIITSSIMLLFEKAFAPISSTVPGTTIFFKFSTDENAPAPILVTEGGISKVPSLSFKSKFLSEAFNSPFEISKPFTFISALLAAAFSTSFVVFIYSSPFIISNFSI